MKKSLTLLSVVAVLMLSGCGSSSSDNDNQVDIESQMVNELVVPEAHKVERANWDGVAPIVENFFITDDETLLSFKIKDTHIATGDFRTESIFIDADNNPETGYNRTRIGSIGAEYMVEGTNLYRYGGNGWSWEFVSSVSRSVQGDEMEVEFSKASLNLSETLSATASLIDNSWSAINRTDVATFTPSVGNNLVSGSSISTEVNNFGGMGPFHSRLNITLTSQNISSQDFRTEAIFIDADNNPTTGYNRTRIGSIGADYLIEGDRVYRYSGDDGWSWRIIDPDNDPMQYTRDGSTISIALDRGSVPLSSSIRVSSFIYDRDWRATESFGASETISLNMEEQIRSIIGENLNIVSSITLDTERKLAIVSKHYWDDPMFMFFGLVDYSNPLNPRIIDVDSEMMIDSPHYTWSFTGESTMEYSLFHEGQHDDINAVVRTGTFDYR